MKKGEKLICVETSNGRVSVRSTEGSNVKLSRSERNVLSDYKNPNYVSDIIKTFGNPDILADGFTVIKNGVTKFTYTKNK